MGDGQNDLYLYGALKMEGLILYYFLPLSEDPSQQRHERGFFTVSSLTSLSHIFPSKRRVNIFLPE